MELLIAIGLGCWFFIMILFTIWRVFKDFKNL